MADVFVSYASSDRDRVRPIVQLLEAQGWSVWWDRAIAGGEAFDRAIEQAIDEARCIVVVWSAESVESEWVRTEANEGLERGILVPVAIDDVRPPLAFRRTQTLNFSAAPAWTELIEAVTILLPREAARSNQSVLVGRANEVARIDAAIEQAATGAGRLLLISGEAGVGKTRLTQEAVTRGRASNLLALIGHCSEMDGAPPYEPFIEHLEQAARTVSAPALRNALGENASEIVKLMPELRQMYPDIPEAISTSPDQERRYLLNGFGEFLHRSSDSQPLLLVFEDLHWADDSTCIMLRYLAERLRASAVLLIGTYRDSELASNSPFARTLRELVRERLCDDINLSRLDQSSVAELLQARAGAVPPNQLIELVYSETEGNPFFVEEVYRNLEESGRLFNANGNIQSDIEISDTDVPRSVRLVLDQRLERVSDDCRKVLTTAAVAGRQFSFELLIRVAQLDEEQLLDVLDEAAVASLIEDVSTRREAAYGFHHELIRQTLLAALSFPRRQRLHLKIAETLEDLAGDSRISEIAHHYYQAGAAADDDKTIDCLQRAGERASDALAFEDALRQLDLALEIAPEEDAARHAAIQLQRARALRGCVRIDDALDAYDIALQHKLPNTTYEELLRQRAGLLVDLFRSRDARANIEELLERAKARGDQAAELEAQLLLAEAQYRISLDQPEAREPARVATEHAIGLAREVGDKRALAVGLLQSTHFVDYWKEFRPQGVANLQEATRLAEELGDEEIELDAATMALRVNIFTPVEYGIEAEPIRERLEARRDLIRLNQHLFWMITPARLSGQLERSVEISDHAVEVAAQLGVAPNQYPTFKSYALSDLGRFDEAWQALQEEPTEGGFRFGRALQQIGMLQFKAQLGEATPLLAGADEQLAEATDLSRAWMVDQLVNLVAKYGSQAGKQQAVQRFLDHAFQATGTRPSPAARAELHLARQESELALERALQEANYCRERELNIPWVEALEVALRALAAMERWRELLEQAEKPISFAAEHAFARLQWRLHALRAQAYTGLGDAGHANTERAAGGEIFRRIATISDPHLAQCYRAEAASLGIDAGGTAR